MAKHVAVTRPHHHGLYGEAVAVERELSQLPLLLREAGVGNNALGGDGQGSQ